VNSTKKKKQSSIKLALCMTSFVHCKFRRFSTLKNLVLSLYTHNPIRGLYLETPSQHIHITMRSVAATGVYVLRPSTLP
jgi:hypothetical protein